MKKKLVDQLLRNRFQPEVKVRQILEREAERRQGQYPPPRYLRGIRKGQFFRIKLPGGPASLPFRLPKLRNHASPMMKPFVQANKGEPPLASPLEQASQGGWRAFWERARRWLKYNCGVLILNFGSVCSLLAFTRTDILELRSLSVMGSLSSIFYFSTLPERIWTPLIWNSAFLMVNGFKIRDILEERQAVVKFSDKQQEEVYRRYFMPHGASPKQFEYIVKRARTIRLLQGDVLVREGAPMKRVFLVTKGATRAHYLGRRLTAVSFIPTTQEYQAAHQGGSHWIGEMSFLEQYWHKQKSHAPPEVSESPSMVPRRRTHHPVERAMYTISAVEDDTVVLSWTHAELESLLKRSSDLRDVLTRALTAGIVGKVVAFTASKKAASEKQSNWWQSLWSPTPPPNLGREPITWVENDEDEPQKVKIDRKPTFVLPEAE